jgi:hypothetical protein
MLVFLLASVTHLVVAYVGGWIVVRMDKRVWSRLSEGD